MCWKIRLCKQALLFGSKAFENQLGPTAWSYWTCSRAKCVNARSPRRREQMAATIPPQPCITRAQT
eukprot:3665904-Amphidinium_carterae.3